MSAGRPFIKLAFCPMTKPLISGFVMGQNANLINGLPALIGRRLRSHYQMQQLSFALDIQGHRFAIRTADVLREFAPPLDWLPVHRLDQIAFLESPALRWISRRHIFQNGPNWRKTD